MTFKDIKIMTVFCFICRFLLIWGIEPKQVTNVVYSRRDRKLVCCQNLVEYVFKFADSKLMHDDFHCALSTAAKFPIKGTARPKRLTFTPTLRVSLLVHSTAPV